MAKTLSSFGQLIVGRLKGKKLKYGTYIVTCHNKRNSSNNMSSYCKLCHDAGKSESVYRSHSVRDRSGKTVCPYLLSLTCRRCNGKGHTQSHCSATLVYETKIRQPVLEKPSSKKKQLSTNRFADLACLSSDEEADINTSSTDIETAKNDSASSNEPVLWSKKSDMKWCDVMSDDE
jgi:hypothetical protein